jgi:hypothetical protein
MKIKEDIYKHVGTNCYDEVSKITDKRKELVQDIAEEIYNVAHKDPYRYNIEDEVMGIAKWLADMVEDAKSKAVDSKLEEKLEDAILTISTLKIERDSHKQIVEDMVADKTGKKLQEKIDKKLADLEAREKTVIESEKLCHESIKTTTETEKRSLINLKEVNIKIEQANHALALVKHEEMETKESLAAEVKSHRYYVDEIKKTAKILEEMVEKYGKLDGHMDAMVDQMMLDHFEIEETL